MMEPARAYSPICEAFDRMYIAGGLGANAGRKRSLTAPENCGARSSLNFLSVNGPASFQTTGTNFPISSREVAPKWQVWLHSR